MKVTQKFENGLSIVQLEERYEMLAADGHGRGGCLHLGPCEGEDNTIS